MTRLTDTPAWFAEAIGSKPRTGSLRVTGCDIAYRAWGDRGAPVLVLLHGGGAHARWWDHLAPLLAEGGHHVVVPDLSGHGDSGRRDVYGLHLWAEEALAVAEDAGPGGAGDHGRAPVLVGHSLGGLVAITAAATAGDRLDGAIIVDARVAADDSAPHRQQRTQMAQRPKTYPSVEDAVARFRLVPPQPPGPGFVMAHVARHSLRETDDGCWTWKFDPLVFGERGGPQPEVYGQLLEQARCRMAVVHGERSEATPPDVVAYMAARLGDAPFVEIPRAHHHLILDQPLAFVAAVRALLASWRHAPRPGLGNGREAW